MQGELAEHMIEKADPGVDLVLTRAVELQRHRDLGLVCLAMDLRFTHHSLQFR